MKCLLKGLGQINALKHPSVCLQIRVF